MRSNKGDIGLEARDGLQRVTSQNGGRGRADIAARHERGNCSTRRQCPPDGQIIREGSEGDGPFTGGLCRSGGRRAAVEDHGLSRLDQSCSAVADHALRPTFQR